MCFFKKYDDGNVHIKIIQNILMLKITHTFRHKIDMFKYRLCKTLNAPLLFCMCF